MPTAAPKPCTSCGVLVRDGSSRCAKHKVAPGSFADERRGSRHKRGYGSAWDKKREGILIRDEGTCQVHLQQGLIHRGTHVDHKVNKAEWRRLHGSLAGCDDDSNLWCVCVDWHRSKTAREGAQGAGLLPRQLPPGGHENSGAPTEGTGLPAAFLRAQVLGVGGGDLGGKGG
jgi:5-methylcytosine-specific restriction protein A